MSYPLHSRRVAGRTFWQIADTPLCVWRGARTWQVKPLQGLRRSEDHEAAEIWLELTGLDWRNQFATRREALECVKALEALVELPQMKQHALPRLVRQPEGDYRSPCGRWRVRRRGKRSWEVWDKSVVRMPRIAESWRAVANLIADAETAPSH